MESINETTGSIGYIISEDGSLTEFIEDTYINK